jgi:hypothetical protein
MRNAAEMFSFDPNPTRAKNAWSSSTCLLYVCHRPKENAKSIFAILCCSPVYERIE